MCPKNVNKKHLFQVQSVIWSHSGLRQTTIGIGKPQRVHGRLGESTQINEESSTWCGRKTPIRREISGATDPLDVWWKHRWPREIRLSTKNLIFVERIVQTIQNLVEESKRWWFCCTVWSASSQKTYNFSATSVMLLMDHIWNISPTNYIVSTVSKYTITQQFQTFISCEVGRWLSMTENTPKPDLL